MSRAATTTCPMCRAIVYEDGVHSCFDADLLLTVKDAERAVLNAARRWYLTRDTYLYTDPLGRSRSEISNAEIALFEAVDAMSNFKDAA